MGLNRIRSCGSFSSDRKLLYRKIFGEIPAFVNASDDLGRSASVSA